MGLALHKSPAVAKLTQFEAMLVAPRLAMAKFVEILPYRNRDKDGKQARGIAPLAMRGGVVNVPVVLDKVQLILPRSLQDSQLMAVGLKRDLNFKWVIANGMVRPHLVLEALEQLTHEELYKELGIAMRPEWVDGSAQPRVTNEQHAPTVDAQHDNRVSTDGPIARWPNRGGMHT